MQFFDNLDAEGYTDKDPELKRIIESEPVLHVDLYEDWNIFWRLSAQRRIDGFAGRVEPIRISEIESYMRLNRITDEDEQNRLIERIEFLDKIFCDYYNGKKNG